MAQLVGRSLGRTPSPYNVSGTHEAKRGVVATTVAEDGEMAEVWEGGDSEAPAMLGRGRNDRTCPLID